MTIEGTVAKQFPLLCKVALKLSFNELKVKGLMSLIYITLQQLIVVMTMI